MNSRPKDPRTARNKKRWADPSAARQRQDQVLASAQPFTVAIVRIHHLIQKGGIVGGVRAVLVANKYRHLRFLTTINFRSSISTTTPFAYIHWRRTS